MHDQLGRSGDVPRPKGSAVKNNDIDLRTEIMRVDDTDLTVRPITIGDGKRLARRLAALATERGYETFVATLLPDNRAALGLVRKLVPDATVRFAGGEYQADMPLVRAS